MLGCNRIIAADDVEGEEERVTLGDAQPLRSALWAMNYAIRLRNSLVAVLLLPFSNEPQILSSFTTLVRGYVAEV